MECLQGGAHDGFDLSRGQNRPGALTSHLVRYPDVHEHVVASHHVRCGDERHQKQVTSYL